MTRTRTPERVDEAGVKVKLTAAMRRALSSGIETGDVTRHLRGQSAWGGWNSTRAALRRHGLIDHESKVTEAGRAALAKVRTP